MRKNRIKGLISFCKNFIGSAVTTTLKRSGELLTRVGVTYVVVRQAEADACDYCKSKEGIHYYAKSSDTSYFRRHTGCQCTFSTKVYEVIPSNIKEKEEGRKRRERLKTYGLNEQTGKDSTGNYENDDNSKKQKSKSIVTDVTKEFLEKAKPNVGNVTIEESGNNKKKQNEIATAKWLLTNFGGEIIVLKENAEKGTTPDYLWNNTYWELKNATSRTSIDSRLRSASKQLIYNNSGVVIDISESKLELEEALKNIEELAVKRIKKDTFIIVKKNDILIKVLKIKK